MTPHEAMAAWGITVAAAQAARVLADHAGDAYDKAALAEDACYGHSEDVEEELVTVAGRAARGAANDAYATYAGAFEAAVSARAAVCDAYVSAGRPRAVLALGAIACGALDWSPDLEDALDALLRDPVRP